MSSADMYGLRFGGWEGGDRWFCKWVSWTVAASLVVRDDHEVSVAEEVVRMRIEDGRKMVYLRLCSQ